MNKKDANLYIKGSAESISNISERLKNIAQDILNYSGGIGCDSTDKFASEIIGAAGLLDYMAKCMTEYSEDAEGK